nr:hypothetical protein [Tanacetum cinerariifolium]
MTPEAVRVMIDQTMQRNSTNGDESHSFGGGPTRPAQSVCACSYSDFMKCQPLNLRGTEGVAGLSCWFEKMELELTLMCSKFVADEKEKVDKYIGGLPDNIHGNVMSARPKTLDEAIECISGGILWWNDWFGYWVEKVDKYIGGLPDNIHGNVMSARPKTLDEAIELANDLMDQKLHTYAERHNKVRGNLITTTNLNKFPRDRMWLKITSLGLVKGRSMLELFHCTTSGHYKSACPELKNQNHGKQAEGTRARGMV